MRMFKSQKKKDADYADGYKWATDERAKRVISQGKSLHDLKEWVRDQESGLIRFIYEYGPYPEGCEPRNKDFIAGVRAYIRSAEE